VPLPLQASRTIVDSISESICSIKAIQSLFFLNSPTKKPWTQSDHPDLSKTPTPLKKLSMLVDRVEPPRLTLPRKDDPLDSAQIDPLKVGNKSSPISPIQAQRPWKCRQQSCNIDEYILGTFLFRKVRHHSVGAGHFL
jgi:hypothetical protein